MAVNVTTGLHNFELFTNTTGPTFLSGAKEAVNDAQKRNYRTLGYLLRGQQMSKVLQGGLNIQDYIYLATNARARTYKPGISRQSYSAPQPGTLWTQHWRFFITDMVWYEEEIDLQAGSEMSSEARYAKYKDIWFAKQQDLWTDQMNYWEAALWAQPSANTMEGTGATADQMMSIPAFINEFTNGTPPATDGTWATVQGITAGTTNWAPTKITYGTTASSGFAANNIENVISALDEAFDKMDWEAPPTHKEFFEGSNLEGSTKPFIACSQNGKKRLIGLYRSENDRWDNTTDPWMQPTYAGFPIVYIAQLDAASIHSASAGAAFGTESTATNTGPRYFGIHPKYMSTVWHKDKYMTKREVPVSREEPTTHVVPYVTYGNLVARSRARHFILTPGSSY